MKKITLIITALLLTVLLSGCIPGDGSYTQDDPAGFFWGIWHGWVAPVSLIISIFNEDITIYESSNTGFWYDFAYYAAIVGGFGGFSLFRKKRKGHED